MRNLIQKFRSYFIKQEIKKPKLKESDLYCLTVICNKNTYEMAMYVDYDLILKNSQDPTTDPEKFDAFLHTLYSDKELFGALIKNNLEINKNDFADTVGKYLNLWFSEDLKKKKKRKDPLVDPLQVFKHG